MTASEKAKMAMDSAIWKHGRKKSELTIIINKLRGIDLKDHPDVINCIALLTLEREKLKSKNVFG